MARQPTSGQGRNVTTIVESYDVGTNDDIVSLSADWAGGTIVLPGPLSGNDPPNNGDEFTICDPTNALATHSGIINGGGYQFLGGDALVTQTVVGSLVQAAGSSGEDPTISKTCVSFIFNAEQQIWIVC